MISVHLKKGYTLKVAGAPSPKLETLDTPSHVAVLPERIPFVKPRLKVTGEQTVRIGSVLFEDKRNPDFRCLSPGGGRIAKITYGPRRVVQEIVIELDASEQETDFETLSETDIDSIDRDRLVRMILDGGFWVLLRELPFRDMPKPDTVPPAIYVTVGNTEPFHPKPEVFLKGHGALFRYGIKVLNKLADRAVYVAAARNDAYVFNEFKDLITHAYSGNYPVHDAGVLVYHTKRSSDQNRSWAIDAQDLLLLAELLKTGRYPTQRIVVVAGTLATLPQHLQTRLGAPLAHLVQDRIGAGEPRYIVGGILTGYKVSKDSHLGLLEKSLSLLPEGNEKEVLALFRPGFRKPSYSWAYASVLNRGDFDMDCNRHGGRRACIGCNHCPDVCPVDILPQLTYKNILSEAVEDYLAHGLLDCVECGLCSYVCPAKIELYQTLKAEKAAYYSQQAS